LPCRPWTHSSQIEYLVVCIDQSGQKVRLSLRQADILASLSARQDTADANDESRYARISHCTTAKRNSASGYPVFHPEFGRFMLEATPGKPWVIDIHALLDVERDMKQR
jgi:glutamate--cysteine ligase catalytic subunit